MPEVIKYQVAMIFMGFCLLPASTSSLAARGLPHDKNVLVFHSYHHGLKGNDEIDNDFHKAILKVEIPFTGRVVNQLSPHYSQFKDQDWIIIGILSALILLIIFLSINIFKRGRTEKALRESEAWLRTIFAAQEVSFIMTDLNGSCILEFSPGAEHIFGYRREEVIGQPAAMLHLPENVVGFPKAIESMRQKKTGFAGEIVLVRKNGEQFPVLYSTNPIFNEKGAMVAILDVSIDITQLREAQEALRQSEKHFRDLFNSVSDLVYTHDLKGRFISVNPATAKIFGYEQETLIGRKITDFMKPELKELFASEYMEPLETKGYNEGITSYFSKDGNKIYIEYHCSLVKPEEGKPYVSGTGRNVSERVLATRELKKLQQQMIQAKKMEAIGVLAGGVAHDFNNLLMAILGTTSLMLLNEDTHHPHYQKLKNIEQYVQSGTELTKQLLGFARGGKYEVKPTDLNELIKNQSQMFGRTKKEITIHEKYDRGLWIVEVDRGQIEQSLLNLFINAWQAMPGGGDLYIQTENVILDENYVKSFSFTPGKYTKISITDSGVGMDEPTRQRIFEPFFTTKEMGRGTGLGLASVYGIIKNHGGIINVYSEKGEGTTFTIYLPAGKSEDVAPLEKDEKEDEIQPGTETILLVDDEEMILEVGREMLEMLGYQVIIAESGERALDIYRANRGRIDLIILDMIMPDMGGGEVHDQLRSLDPELRVLLSSGYSLNGQARDILARGCNGFIQKPFKLKPLSQKIRGILARPIESISGK